MFGTIKDSVCGVTSTGNGTITTDNPVVEYSIAGAIILGAAGLCWKTITDGN